MTVTETIVEGGPGLGSWELELVAETPDDVLDQLGFFGHIAIVAGEGIDVVGTGDALLAGARYVGVLRGKGKGNRRRMAGSGMVFWLGDEDNKGHVFEAELNIVSKTMAEAVALAMPPSAQVGTVWPQTDPAARYTGKHRYQSPRQVLTAIAQAFGAEIRVNGDGTVDVGTQAQLYEATPAAIVSRTHGTDMDLVSLEGDPEVDEATYDLSTRIVLMGQTVEAGEFAVGSMGTVSADYVDLFGNPVKLTRLISESAETTGTVAQRAQLQYNRFNRVTRSLRLSADEYAAEGGPFAVGDMVYAYDPDTGIVDPAREVEFRGERIWPDIIRVNGLTWPVTRGHTVAFRTNAGTWLDLTRFVTWETTGGELVVGDLPTSLARPSDDPIQLRIDASRGQVPPDVVAPGVPTALTLSTYAFVDPRGQNVARLIVGWTAPTTNADGSVPLDLSFYIVQWREQGRTTWRVTYTPDPTIELSAAIDTNYEVKVAAVDSSNNIGTYTAIATIKTSVDTTPPSVPADPVVTDVRGSARVEYIGTAAGGGAMPVDTRDVDVHQGTTSTFTPTAATRVSSLAPFAKGVHIADVPDGVTRWFRLVAVDNAGNASAPSAAVSFTGRKLADGEIGSLSVAKLLAGTVLVDIVMGGRFTTALTGARTEMNALGFQRFLADGSKVISLTDTESLLTGKIRTALSGRRIEIGMENDPYGTDPDAAGTIRFFSGVGTNSSVFRSGTAVQPGVGGAAKEMLELGFDIAGGHEQFGKFSATEEGYLWSVGRMLFNYVGGEDTAFQRGYQLRWIPDKDGVTGTSRLKFGVDSADQTFIASFDTLRFYPNYTIGGVLQGETAGQYVGIVPVNSAAGGSAVTPELRLFSDVQSDGFTYGTILAYTPGTGGAAGTATGPRLLVRNAGGGSSYQTMMALAYLTSSDEALKVDVQPVTESAIDQVRGTRLESWRRRYGRGGRRERRVPQGEGMPDLIVDEGPDERDGETVEVGLVAQRAPRVMVDGLGSGDAALNLSTGVALALASVAELIDLLDIDDLRRRKGVRP